MLYKSSSLLKGTFLLAIIVLDPLGLVSASDQASANFINRFQSVSYPTTGQQEITVVIIDDAYLKHIKNFWPLPYHEQAKLFRKILSFKPQSLFIDLLYTHDRTTEKDSTARIVNTLDKYKKLYDINSYIASVNSKTSNVPIPIKNYTNNVQVKWTESNSQYPLLVNGKLSAATRLYNEYCKKTKRCAAINVAENISVQWGQHIDPFQKVLSPSDLCESPPSAFSMILSDILWRFKSKFRQTCPYHKTVMASLLIGNDDEANEVLKSAFSGKIVLIGANIEGAKDTYLSPIHGQLPGVFYHAMALDNLITYQNNYKKEAPKIFDTQMNYIDIAEVLFVALILFLGWIKNTTQSPMVKAPYSHHKIISLLSNMKAKLRDYSDFSLLFIICLLLIVSCYISIFTNYRIINFVGLMTLAVSLIPPHFLKKMVNFRTRNKNE